MDVRASSVIRVIIAGEWIWVEPGTFTVKDFVFVDEQGHEINRANEPAYHFVSTNGDPYYGPLSAIQLIKLRAPELDGLPHDGTSPSQLIESPSGTPTPETATEPAAAAAATSAADSLFSDPLPMPSGDSTEQGRGLL